MTLIGGDGTDGGADAVVVTYPRDDIALVTLNRPAKLNAMNQALVDGIYAACDEIDAQPRLRVAILTGEGRGFCAGADLGGFGTVPGTEDLGQVYQFFAIQQKITGLIPRLQHLRVPVIAAVNGAAAGGGFALVLGSDIRIASTAARFNAAFIRIGLSACDIGVSWMLPRLVGAARAHELMLTGRIFDADEAERIGLVTDVVPSRSAARRRAREGGRDLCEQPVGRVHDQGGHVERARDREPPGGRRSREPHAGARRHDGGRPRGDDRVPAEAAPRLEVRVDRSVDRRLAALVGDVARLEVPGRVGHALVAQHALEAPADRAARQLVAELDVAGEREVRELLDAPAGTALPR